jgi:hypothetical protein
MIYDFVSLQAEREKAKMWRDMYVHDNIRVETVHATILRHMHRLKDVQYNAYANHRIDIAKDARTAYSYWSALYDEVTSTHATTVVHSAEYDALVAKLTKVRALAQRPGCEGERIAAQAAVRRLEDKLAHM